jgi:aspartyl-tRNA(Asn)/glutamyl-tRNA(Gln) amidotransferase subunit C
MSLQISDVAKVALLARLDLSSAELSAMARHLTDIVGYVEQLQGLDTTGVEPMAHAIDIRNVMADDCIAPSLPRELALQNAPKQDGQYYLVPAVLGE